MRPLGLVVDTVADRLGCRKCHRVSDLLSATASPTVAIWKAKPGERHGCGVEHDGDGVALAPRISAVGNVRNAIHVRSRVERQQARVEAGDVAEHAVVAVSDEANRREAYELRLTVAERCGKILLRSGGTSISIRRRVIAMANTASLYSSSRSSVAGSRRWISACGARGTRALGRLPAFTGLDGGAAVQRPLRGVHIRRIRAGGRPLRGESCVEAVGGSRGGTVGVRPRAGRGARSAVRSP